MKGALLASPSQNVGDTATYAWTIGTEDPNYPAQNAATLEPDVPAKTTNDGTALLQATLLVPRTLEGVALINCSFRSHTVELSNNAGMAGQFHDVMSPEDGLCVNAWWDLRGVANTTADEWSVTITGATAPIAIGTLLLIRTWHHLRVRWDWELREKFPVIAHRTGYGKRLQYQIPTRTRIYRALAIEPQDRDDLRTLRREAHGSIGPWTLVPDETDVDVLLVQFLEDTHSETYRLLYGTFPEGTASGLLDMPLEVEEVNAGVAL